MSFRVIWKKKNYDVTFGHDKKAVQLKEHIQTLTGTNQLRNYGGIHIIVLLQRNSRSYLQ